MAMPQPPPPPPAAAPTAIPSIERRLPHISTEPTTHCRPYNVIVLSVIRVTLDSTSPDNLSYSQMLAVLAEMILQEYAPPDLETCTSSLGGKSEEIKRMLTPLPAFLDFFASYHDILNAPIPRLAENSILNLYVKKYLLAFEYLLFHEQLELFEEVSEYLNISITYPELMPAAGTTSLAMDPLWRVKSLPESVRAVEDPSVWLERQVWLLAEFPEKAQPPDIMERRISDILKDHPHLFLARYVRYMNAVRSRDYTTARCALHEFYSHIRPGLARKDDIVTTSDIPTRRYHYAALNMCQLDTMFGRRRTAALSLDEAVRIAQTARDDRCLEHALVWLQLDSADSLRSADLKSDSKAAPLPHASSFLPIGFWDGSRREDLLVTQMLLQLNLPSSSREAPESVGSTHKPPEANSRIGQAFRVAFGVSAPPARSAYLSGKILAQQTSLWMLLNEPTMASLYAQVALRQPGCGGDRAAELLAVLARCAELSAEPALADALLSLPTSPSTTIRRTRLQLAWHRAYRADNWSECRRLVEEMDEISPPAEKQRFRALLKAPAEHRTNPAAAAVNATSPIMEWLGGARAEKQSQAMFNGKEFVPPPLFGALEKARQLETSTLELSLRRCEFIYRTLDCKRGLMRTLRRKAELAPAGSEERRQNTSECLHIYDELRELDAEMNDCTDDDTD